MYFENYSFLYPLSHKHRDLTVDQEVIKQLNVTRFLGTDISHYFTDDISVITYRQQLFQELDTTPKLTEFLSFFKEKLDILDDLCQSGKENVHSFDTDHKVRDLVLLSFYTELIKELKERLFEVELSCESLLNFRGLLTTVTESEDFVKLSQSLGEISVTIESIKSITVGVNLDAQLRPVEAGVVSFNAEYYQSGEWIDKLLRMDFSKSDYTCIAPMTRLSKKLTLEENQQFRTAINNAMDKVLTDSVKIASASTLGIRSSVFEKGTQFYRGRSSVHASHDKRGWLLLLPCPESRRKYRDLRDVSSNAFTKYAF